jgi:hypothetical protein
MNTTGYFREKRQLGRGFEDDEEGEMSRKEHLEWTQRMNDLGEESASSGLGLRAESRGRARTTGNLQIRCIKRRRSCGASGKSLCV